MTTLKEKQGAAKWEAVRTTKLTLTDAQINKKHEGFSNRKV
jgi:hypothetical protein